MEAMAAQGKELTAAQKRKLKKKQREKEKKAAGGKVRGWRGPPRTRGKRQCSKGTWGCSIWMYWGPCLGV